MPHPVVSNPEIDTELVPFFNRPKNLNGLSGVAIMAVDREGQVIYSNAFGRRSLNAAEGEAMSTDTLCWIASQTKLMTAIAVMQCVERGQIGLDDPVGAVFPELAEIEIIEGFEDDGKPKTRKAEEKLTLRNMLSHTSGFAYHWLHPNVPRWLNHKGIKHGINLGHMEQLSYPLVFEPNSGYLYGVGLDWAGQIVERLNNCTLAQYMEDNIWEPLGMNSTTFHPEKRPELLSQLAGTGLRADDGTIVPAPHPLAIPAPHSLGGAGAYSTCEDYIKLLTAVLQDGRGILRKESVDEMFKPVLTGTLIDDFVRARGYRYPPGTKLNVGLTVELNVEDIPGGRSAGSGSWGGLPNLLWWIDRDTGIAATIFQHVLPFGEKISLDFGHTFERALYKYVRNR